MTVKKRLAQSNIVMLLVPLLVLVVLGLGGAAVFLYILDTSYLPRVGMSLADIHNSVEEYETMFASFEVREQIYVGILCGDGLCNYPRRAEKNRPLLKPFLYGTQSPAFKGNAAVALLLPTFPIPHAPLSCPFFLLTNKKDVVSSNSI